VLFEGNAIYAIVPSCYLLIFVMVLKLSVPMNFGVFVEDYVRNKKYKKRQ